MKIKPKEILVNLPVVLLFDNENDIPELASNFNTFIHGKVKLKYEMLGNLNKQFVGLFYLQRNDEFSQLRAQFVSLIEAEEIAAHDHTYASMPKTIDAPVKEEEKYLHKLCDDCNNFMLHIKGEDHCRCGGQWIKNKCETFGKLFSSVDNDYYEATNIKIKIDE